MKWVMKPEVKPQAARAAGRQIIIEFDYETNLLLCISIVGGIVVFRLLALDGRRCCRYVAVIGGWYNASQRASVKHKHCWASLQTRIATLALPIAIA